MPRPGKMPRRKLAPCDCGMFRRGGSGIVTALRGRPAASRRAGTSRAWTPALRRRRVHRRAVPENVRAHPLSGQRRTRLGGRIGMPPHDAFERVATEPGAAGAREQRIGVAAGALFPCACSGSTTAQVFEAARARRRRGEDIEAPVFFRRDSSRGRSEFSSPTTIEARPVPILPPCSSCRFSNSAKTTCRILHDGVFPHHRSTVVS